MSLPTFHVDFNELVQPDLVLFSQHDERQDVEGRSFTLVEGMRVRVTDEDLGEDGSRDDLFAVGIVVPNGLGRWLHVKWCCQLDAPGVRHLSDIENI